MGVIDRLSEFQSFVSDKYGGRNKFEGYIGVSAGYITNMLKKDGAISSDVMIKLNEKFPELNLEWLITGKGNMIKSSDYIHRIDHPKAVEKTLTDQEVTLYDIYAAANLKTLLANKDQNILGKISIPDMPRCDGAIYVTGDSMYPLLKSGDIVAYREIKEFQDVIFGEMYLVSFELSGDEYLAVKYVNRSEEDGKIKLVSYNTHHEPKDIPVDSIRAMALVKLSIRKNTMI